MSASEYTDLGFKRWPFQVGADRDGSSVWAGRPIVKRQINRLTRRLQMSPASTFHLIWADLGAGKTHTLLHLAHLCERSDAQALPVYAALPNDRVGFMSMYRAIARALPIEKMSEKRIDAHSNASEWAQTWNSTNPDLSAALWVMGQGDDRDRATAMRWFTSEKGTTVAQVQKIGISTPIRDLDFAAGVLSGAVELLTHRSYGGERLYLMIDEFQRAGELPPAALANLNTGIQRLFDNVQQFFSIFLSFTFGNPKNIKFILSEALLDRADKREIRLAPLSDSESTDFVGDLLQGHQGDPDRPRFYPFTEDAIRVAVRHVRGGNGTSPRDLIQAFDDLLGTALADGLVGPDSLLDAQDAEVILGEADPSWR